MKKKLIKGSKTWKPKHRWITSTTVDIKTGKTKHEYYVPKTPEEEKRLEAEHNEKMRQVFEILFPTGI